MEPIWDWLMKAGKWVLGGIASLWGLIIPLHTLIICVVITICIDFITGNIADYYRHKRTCQRYAFESEKAWKTVWKMGLSIIGMGIAWMLDEKVLPLNTLNLANFFAAFIIGAEFWSFLENSAIISDHPIFRSLRKYMKTEIKKKTDIDIDDCDEKK